MLWLSLVIVSTFLVTAVGAILVVALIRARRRAKEDDNRTLKDVRAYLTTLLRRGHNHAFIIITDIPTDTFVQFAKYVWPGREIGLQLGFPRAPWSEPSYGKLQAFLERHNIPFSVQPTGKEPVTEMLHVDCQRDVDRAMFLIEGIFHEVFGVPPNRAFRVRGEGMTFKDELIDTVDPDN